MSSIEVVGAGEHAAPIPLGNVDDNSFRGAGVQRAQATLERGRDVRVAATDVQRAREAVREQLLDEHHPLGRNRTVELGQARRKREDKLEVRPHGTPIQRHCADKRRALELPGEALQRPGEDPAIPRAGELRSAPHEKRRLWMHLHAGAQQAVCLPPKQRAVSSGKRGTKGRECETPRGDDDSDGRRNNRRRRQRECRQRRYEERSGSKQRTRNAELTSLPVTLAARTTHATKLGRAA